MSDNPASERNSTNAMMALFAILLPMSFSGLPNVAAAQPQIPKRIQYDFDGRSERPPEGWRVVAGDWRVEDGALRVDSLSSEAYITFGKSTWRNYEVEVDLTFLKVRNRSRWVSILCRASPDGAAPWSQVPVRFDATASNGTEFAVRTAKGWSVRSKSAASKRATLNKSRRLRVLVKGFHVEAFLDGQPVIRSDFCVDRRTGCLGLGVSGCIATFDNVSVLLLPETEKSPTSPSTNCDIVAHRGFSAVAPENTLAAIRQAIQAGATGCEFDVHASQDGTVVLMHDKSVNRTTNGTGLVKNMSLKQLKKLDAGSWKSSKFRGERIPTLIEALELLKPTDCQPVIEVKMEGISQKVVDDIRSTDMVDQVAVIAFSKSVVRELRSIEPRLKCAWLCGETIKGTATQRADWLQARARECNAKLLDLNFKIVSPELIAELKRRNLGIWTWTVNEPTVMRALREWGVDSITTDRPDLLSKLPD